MPGSHCQLGAHLERGRNHSLGRYNCSSNRHHQGEDEPSRGNAVEKGVCVGVWVLADVRGLAAVGQQQTRVGIAQPTELDGVAAKGTNIGKEGLDASEG